MEKNRLAQVTNQLNSLLTPHVQAFEHCRDYTDIHAWVLKAQNILKANPSPYILERVQFSECLSKCLHRNQPIKNQELTLQLYFQAFKNIRDAAAHDINEYVKLFAQDLPLYSVGLYPFAAYATNNSRLKLIEIFTLFYVDLARELTPTLPGLLSCLLPLLEQNDPLLKSQLRKLLALLLERTGRKYFVGSVWLTILKDSRSRIGGITVLGEVIQKMKVIQGEGQFQGSSQFSEYKQDKIATKHILKPRKESTTDLLSESKEQPRSRTPDRLVSGFLEEIEPRSAVSVIKDRKYFALDKGDKTDLRRLKKWEEWLKGTQQVISPPRVLQKKQSYEVQVNVKALEEKVQEVEMQVMRRVEPLPERKLAQLDKAPRVQKQQLSELPLGENNFETNFPNMSSLTLSSLIACLGDKRPLVRRHCMEFLLSHLRPRCERLEEEVRERLVEAVLMLLIKKDIAVSSRVNQWLFGQPDEENVFHITDHNNFIVPLVVKGLQRMLQRPPSQDTPSPLRIIQNILMSHQNMVELLLPPTIFPLMRWIYNFNDEGQLLKTAERLFEGLQSYYPLLVKSLVEELHNEDLDQEEYELQSFEAVKYVQFCYLRLMRRSPQNDDSFLTVAISQMAAAFQVRRLGSVLLPVVDLFYHLVQRKVEVDHILNGQLQIIMREASSGKDKKRMQAMQRRLQVRRQTQETLNQVNRKVGAFFSRLVDQHFQTAGLDRLQNVFRGLIMVLIRLQYLGTENYRQLPEWFSGLEKAIRVKNPMISLSAVSGLIDILVSQGESKACVALKRLVQDSSSKNKEYTRQALEKLWSLLDYPHIHHNIIDLILNFSHCFPNFFTQTITESFRDTSEVAEKQSSIRRFAHFWRLTNARTKGAPEGFSQLAELSKRGLYFMLDYLEDVNPLVRHASKTWLLESTAYFSRVIDPIFRDLLSASAHKYETDSGQVFFTEQYDTNLVFKLFRRVKSILSNNTADFLKYIYSTELTQALIEDRVRLGDTVSPFIHRKAMLAPPPPSSPPVHDQAPAQVAQALLEEEPSPIPQPALVPQQEVKFCYLDLLIYICLRYIESFAAESLNTRFAFDNSAVNASACELLDSLILSIESAKLSRKVIEFVLGKLLLLQRFVIINEEFVVQVQILNLFKSIFFNSAFRLKGELPKLRKTFGKLFHSRLFVENLLMGLTTRFPYVRSQFINFISTCLPIFATYLNQAKCAEVVGAFLTAYYFTIKSIGRKPVDLTARPSTKASDPLRGKIMALKQLISQDEQLMLRADIFRDMSSTTQILTVLHGLRAILDYFFDLNKFDKSKVEFRFVEDLGALDTVLSMATLGIVKREAEKKLIVKSTFLHNLQTCESILDGLDEVFQTVLRAWQLSTEFLRVSSGEFSEIGITTFNFQKFSQFNYHLRDTIHYLATDREMVVSQIVYITRPLFYKFPKEIVQIYLELWVAEGHRAAPDCTFQRDQARNDFLCQLIESLVVNDFPLNIVLAAFMESELVEQVRAMNEKKQAEEKKGKILYFEHVDLECKLLFFLHSYFHYSYMTSESIKRENLTVLWQLVLKALRPFLLSPYPMTNFWVLDFLLLVSRKYSPRQLLSDEKLKTVLHGLVNAKLKYIAEIAANLKSFFYERPDGKHEGEKPPEPYRMILPLSPTLYEEYLRVNTLGEEDKAQIDRVLFGPTGVRDYPALEVKERLMAFFVLKKLGLQLLQNTYRAEMASRVVTRTKEWMQLIFPVIENKAEGNQMFAECASHLVFTLLEKSRALFIEQFKQNILYIFDKDDFFNCSLRSLSFWRVVVDWVVNQRKSDMFKDYLAAVNLDSSYFTKADDNNKRRIKSFQRVCFILFSGGKDRYANRLDFLVSKLSEIIKSAEAAHPSLLILVLFCVRILFHKLSAETLGKVFSEIWPMLLTLLIQMFGRRQGSKLDLGKSLSRNPNLLFAGLKLIETIHLSGLQEFNLHRWIFIFDYFGLGLPVVRPSPELALALEAKGLPLEQANKEADSPFEFRPYLHNHFPVCSVSYHPRLGALAEIETRPRRIVLDCYSVRDEEELRTQAYLLGVAMMKGSESQCRVDEREIERALQKEFTEQDKFIFEVK